MTYLGDAAGRLSLDQLRYHGLLPTHRPPARRGQAGSERKCPMPEKTIRLTVSRPDIRNTDLAGAILQFERDSDGDVEMTVRWDGSEKDRGVYLIPRGEADELAGWLDEQG